MNPGSIAALAILAIGCAARVPPQGLPAPGPPAEAERTILDGVYTQEQGRRGEAIYFATCVRCHRPEMTGSEIVPALIGEGFLARWDRRSAGDLFEKMRTSMPPVGPRDLPPQAYADVLAYILSRNRFPAGGSELAGELTSLAVIRIIPGH